jgi:hypothetical protein
MKTAYIPEFLLGLPKNTVNTVIFRPKANDLVNTVVFGFQDAKNSGIYGGVCSKSFTKKGETPHFSTLFGLHAWG